MRTKEWHAVSSEFCAGISPSLRHTRMAYKAEWRRNIPCVLSRRATPDRYSTTDQLNAEREEES